MKKELKKKDASVLDLEALQAEVAEAIDRKRFLHTVGVRYTAASLAMAYGEDIRRAQIAGILHDCAKGIPNEKRVALCGKYGIDVTECEQKNPTLLHAKLGEYLAEKKYGVEDRGILTAIRYHTTGKPDMTLLEEILFVADIIEPSRPDYEMIETIRGAAFSDLKKAVALELQATLESLNKRGLILDEMTRKAFDSYRIYL